MKTFLKVHSLCLHWQADCFHNKPTPEVIQLKNTSGQQGLYWTWQLACLASPSMVANSMGLGAHLPESESSYELIVWSW